MSLFSWLFGKKIKDDTSVCVPKSGEFSTKVVDSSCYQSELESISGGLEFKFLISQANAEELAYTEIGDYVNLWSPPDEPSKIIIFRRGSVMGGGRLGLVPQNYALIINEHSELELPIETKISEVSQSSCTIYCRLVQAEEVKKEREREEKKLRAELAMPYFPRKPFTVLLKKDLRNLKVGEQYSLTHIPTIDECIENLYAASIVFRSVDGKTIIVKDDDINIIKKVVRLANTFDNFDIRVAQKTSVKSWYEFGSRYGLIITPIKS